MLEQANEDCLLTELANKLTALANNVNTKRGGRLTIFIQNCMPCNHPNLTITILGRDGYTGSKIELGFSLIKTYCDDSCVVVVSRYFLNEFVRHV